MKLKISAALAAITLLTVGSAEAAPPPQQIISSVQKAYSSLRSLDASGTTAESISIGGEKRASKTNYRILFQRPAKLRYEGTIGVDRMLMVSDSRYLYILPPKAKQYRRISLNGSLRPLAPISGPGIGTISLLAGVDFSRIVVKPKVIGEAKVGGVDTYVLQFTLGKKGMGAQKLWIGKKDWLIHRNEITITLPVQRKTGSRTVTDKVVQTATIVVTSIRPNASVSQSAFNFKPPKGVTLFDPKKAGPGAAKKD